MISTRLVELVIDTVVCLTLAKWETVSGQFGGYLRRTRTRTWDPLIKSLRLIVYLQRLACKRPEIDARKINGLKRNCKTSFVCNQISRIRSLPHGTMTSLTGVGAPATKAMPKS